MRIVTLAAPTFSGLAAIGGTAVHDVESLNREIANAEILVLAPRYGAMLREVWSNAAGLRWIHALGAGVETLPFDLLRDSEVIVTNSRGVYADALAEFAIGAILWFAKDFRRLITNQNRRRWEPFNVERLEGATVGIIGFGSVGKAIASRLVGFRMRVLSLGRSGGTPIEELLGSSDYVVLSTPLTPATRHLISAHRIALIAPSAVLINVSRGAVVDEPALVEALVAKRIRGAALDVFESEPLPVSSPLWNLPNVLISPHSADQAHDSHERAVALFLANLERFRVGEPLQNIVDKSAEY